MIYTTRHMVQIILVYKQIENKKKENMQRRIRNMKIANY